MFEDIPAERAEREVEGAAMADLAPAMASETALDLSTTCLLLTPHGVTSAAPVVLAHGGGWTLGSPASSLGIARFIADAARRPVLSAGYRLAPENPWPAPRNDVAAILDAAMSGAVQGLVTYDIVATGFSAGAHLMLSAMLARRDEGRSLPARAVLFYGVYDLDCYSPSYRAYGDGRHGLSRERMQAFCSFLAAERADPTANPATADLAGLPPLHLICGDADVLLSDTLALHARALDAGIAVRLEVLPGRTHGFTNRWFEDAQAAAAIAAAFRP